MTARPRACGKARYPTAAAARSALDLIRRRRPRVDENTPKPCRVYACDECHGYHLTSSPADPGHALRPAHFGRRPRWDDDE